jgi:hypothetical protein
VDKEEEEEVEVQEEGNNSLHSVLAEVIQGRVCVSSFDELFLYIY